MLKDTKIFLGGGSMLFCCCFVQSVLLRDILWCFTAHLWNKNLHFNKNFSSTRPHFIPVPFDIWKFWEHDILHDTNNANLKAILLLTKHFLHPQISCLENIFPLILKLFVFIFAGTHKSMAQNNFCKATKIRALTDQDCLNQHVLFTEWEGREKKENLLFVYPTILWFGFVCLRRRRRALRTFMGSGNNRAEWPPSYSPAAAKNTQPNTTQSMPIRGPGVVASEDIGIGGWRQD